MSTTQPSFLALGVTQASIMSLSLSPSGACLSMPTSCNRCRAQKLKCIVSETSESTTSCQRCARAVVPCIFGRRERRRRTSPLETWQRTSQGSQATLLSTTTHNLNTEALSADLAVGKDWMLHPDNTFPLHDDGAFTSTEGSSSSEQSTTTSLIDFGIFSHAFQDDGSMEEAETFRYDGSTSGPQQQHQVHSLLHEFLPRISAGEQGTDGINCNLFSGMWSHPKIRPTPTRLLHFAAELHKKLDALKSDHSWRHERANLDNYPIGSILELSNQLQCFSASLQITNGVEDAACATQSRSNSNTAEVTEGYQVLVPESNL